MYMNARMAKARTAKVRVATVNEAKMKRTSPSPPRDNPFIVHPQPLHLTIGVPRPSI